MFPDGELDTVSNVQRGMERAGFEILDVEALRPHYAMTLRRWVQRLEARRDEALQHVNEATYRVWRLYMAACALEFEAGGTGIYQVLTGKRREGSPSVPLTRRDIYAAAAPGSFAGQVEMTDEFTDGAGTVVFLEVEVQDRCVIVAATGLVANENTAALREARKCLPCARP